MSEMIERVAEAMRLRAIERGHPIHPVVAHHLAAAAIEAMRAPTAAMIEMGRIRDPLSCDVGENQIAPVYTAIWEGMIDGALP